MSKQTLLLVAVLLMVFGGGVGMGLFLGGGASRGDASEKTDADTSSGAADSSAEAQADVHANTLLSDRIRELEKQLGEQSQNAFLADRLAFFKKYHAAINIQPFDNNLKITPEMAELLGLSPEQVQRIEQHLAQTKSEIDALEDSNTTVTKQTATGASFDISADPKGQTIKDALSQQLVAEMGQEKTDLFLGVSPWAYTQSFADFGSTKKGVDLTWTQQNGKPQYTMTTHSFDSAGHQISISSFSSDALPPEDQKYLPTGP